MKFYFDEAKTWKKTKQSVFDEINNMGLPLVIAGRCSATSPAFLSAIHVPVEYVTSNSPNAWGKIHWGKMVVSPADIPKKYDEYNVLIVTEIHQSVLSEQFRKLTRPPRKIFHLEMKYEGSGVVGVYQDRQDELEQIYDRLADQQSKDTYETMIRYRINRDPAVVTQVALPREEQYFPDSLGGVSFLHDHEIFVDVGAYNGDSAQGFIKAANGKYKHIFSFEPDNLSYSKLEKTADIVHSMTCWNFGVGETREQVHFTSKNMSSQISTEGDELIFVETLDHLLNGIPVTYVKMDIEGMECPALRGAKKLISACKPKLAICMYHSNSDMIDVPKLILELNPYYKLYIRQYTKAISDTVCYAV